MKSEIKKMWVEALRSGEYYQGMGELHPSATQHCCLGVLCEISGIAYESNGSYPDEYVQKWSGLGHNTHLTYNGNRFPIPDLNDEQKLSFNEIADLIEEQL